MLIYSMNTSADGFVADRDGGLDWWAPPPEQFGFHLEQIGSLGGYILGRRLYEAMLVWETDPSLAATEERAAFAAAWKALPKVVFSRTLDAVQGNARLARGTLAEEIATALAGTDRDVAIGGAALAAQAIELDLVDEFRILRCSVLIGGGTPFFPPLSRTVALRLEETRLIGAGVVLDRYRRVDS